MAEDLKIINKILKYYQYNKVDVQNNILHTLREASHVGEIAIFHFSFQPPGSFSGSNISKKVFGAQINVS